MCINEMPSQNHESRGHRASPVEFQMEYSEETSSRVVTMRGLADE